MHYANVLQMGWLRDLMGAVQPPIRSFGALARAALASPDWPADTRVQPRSLAAIFSKLDHDQELAWLEDRAAVQQVLAERLGCALADLKQASTGAPAAAETSTRRVRLDDAPYARALDLVDEPLPPGFPQEITRPSSWDRLWWHAPKGSGRSLAGRWLQARGLSAFVQASSFHEVNLPLRGPVFVELSAMDGKAPAWRAPVCVAAPFLPPDSTAWHVVQSPPVESYIDDLADWLTDRLPPDGRFEPVHAVQWIRKGPLASDVVDTLGAALGLLGLVDQLGMKALAGRALPELARRYFRDRVAQASEKGSADAAWLKRAGFDVLLGVMRRALTDSEAAWDTPRSFDAWLALVPPEQRRGGDLEWMRLSLAESGAPVRPSDIEKAARLVPPGAYRIVRGLSRAGLLEPAGDDRLALGPRWLARVLLLEAQKSLVAASPFEWGEALLSPYAAAGIARALERRIESEQAPVDEVLELEADDNPAVVAALEALFRGVGLALLGGGELPEEQLEALWDEQMRLVVELPGSLPEPRVGPTPRAFDAGSWYLAALAVSEQLPEGGGRKQALLRPWNATEPPRGLRELYDRVAAAAGGSVAAAAGGSVAAFALVDRLRGAVGSVALDGGGPHALERPGLVLDEVAHGVLGWEALVDVAADGVPALAELAERRHMPWAEVARAMWNAWHESAQPADDFPALLAPEAPHAARLWAHLPGPLVVPLLEPRGGASVRLPWSALGEEQWAAVVEGWAALRADAAGARAAFSAIPEQHAMLAVDAGVLSDNAADRALLSALWERFAEQLALRVESRRSAGGVSAALPLLFGAPPSQTERAVELMGPPERLLELDEAELDGVRRWLLNRVHARTAAWRDAYALLGEVEHGLAPVRY